MKLPQARTEKLTIRELPEETLVYDLLRNKSHCLNRAAALVWQHCDGQTTVADMAAILHEELDLPSDQHLVRLALEQLSRRQLLQTPVAPLSGKARMTRRDALKKIAVAAAALPIVMTMTAKIGRVHASIICPECQLGPDRGHCFPVANGQPCSNGGQCQNGACVHPTNCPGGRCNNDADCPSGAGALQANCSGGTGSGCKGFCV